MPKNAHKLTSTDIFIKLGNAAVRQDKIGRSSDRVASVRPVRIKEELRSAPGNPLPVRRGTHVPVTAHVRPEVKAELQRLARQGKKRGEWLSLSQTAAALLEQGIQGTIDMQYGALLRPIIEMELKKGLLAYSNRTANLAVNAFYSAEETRILIIQLLSYLLGDQSDILPGLIAQSQKEAVKNLKSRLLTDLEGEKKD